MIMKNKYIFLLFLSVFGVFVFSPLEAVAKKKKKGKIEQVKPKSAYEKLLKDKPNSVETKGLMNLYWVDDKVYMEIPRDVLGKRLLMGGVVDKLSNPQESSVGFCPVAPLQVKFCRSDSLVRLYQVADRPVTEQDSRIGDALKKSFSDVILNQFSIKAYSPDSALVIDVTSYVFQDDKYMNPIDPKAYNTMGGWVKRKASFKQKQSMISGIASYPDNVSISCYMSYELAMSLFGIFPIAENIPFSAVVKRTFMLLPEDGDYCPRLADPRIGTLWSGKVNFSDKEQGSNIQYWVNRWNLAVDKPVVFYVDTLLPEKWQKCVYRSAEIWNKSFQKIGFSNALDVKPYPKDIGFDANSITKSCIRYVVSPSGQITDNYWSDPLTGEIISANIYIPHNLASKIQLNYFLQTASFNEKARTLMPDEDLVEEALTSLLLRHWGHCLGLTDNMAGSIAYPVDSLQSKEFVKKHGLSASVMDKLPMNYLLSVDNYSADIPLTQQVLGEYDHWAIRYLYQPMNKKTPQEELSDLRKLVSERNQNPLLLFKRPQSRKAYYDPRGMEMDLGNDAIRAATIAFENLGKVVANANQWLDKEDFNYEKRASLYGEIINQADEYVKHVLQQVGGIYLNDSYQGDSYPSYQPVSKEVQRRSYQWMMEAISQMSWLDNRELLNHCALTGSAADYSQKFFANLLLIQLNNLWLSESKSSDPYTQQQAVEDLKNHLFKETRAGKEPDDWKRFLQGQLLSFVISWSNVNVPKGKDETANASSKLTIQTVCPYRGMTAIESIPYSSAPERAPFWYGCLLDLKSEFTRAKSVAPNREMQEEYDYRLFTIEKALRK